MIVKAIPIKTYIKGRGLCYQKGGNLFFNTLKSIGRNFKDVFFNVVKPKAIALGKQGLEFGMDMIKDNKNEIRNIIDREGRKMIKKLSEKSINQVFKQTKESLKNEGKELLNTNKKKISNKAQEMLDSLIKDGSGLKITN